MNLPDLLRAKSVWLTKPRLVVGGVLCTLLGGAAALLCAGPDAGGTLTGWVLFLQGAVLFFYGVPAAVNDFVDEHRNNTWDMLRLTPLSAVEIVVGRLAASTSYAVFLALALAPWALFAQAQEKAPGFLTLALMWTVMASGFVASAATGMAGAALAARAEAGKVGNAGMAMGGLGFLVSGYAQTMLVASDKTNTLLGSVPTGAYLLGALALAAFWGTAAAAQMVGRLLSEPRRPWVLPCFLTTLWAYLALWLPGRDGGSDVYGSVVCVTAPAVVALLSAFGDGEGPEEWRGALRRVGRRGSWLELAPSWLPAWLTVAGVAGLTAAARPEAARIAALAVVFLARDLFLVSALRAVMRRNYEVVAAALLGSLYLLPILYMSATETTGLLYRMVPMQADKVGFLTNILPGFLQACAAGALLSWRVRSLKKETPLLG